MAGFLIDTHLLLWAAGDPDRLPSRARAVLDDVTNEILFSAASIWEIAIKASLSRTDFLVEAGPFAAALLTHGYLELPVSSVHAARVQSLPPHHRDPFDRILIAQADIQQVTLLTHDEQLRSYQGPVEVC